MPNYMRDLLSAYSGGRPRGAATGAAPAPDLGWLGNTARRTPTSTPTLGSPAPRSTTAPPALPILPPQPQPLQAPPTPPAPQPQQAASTQGGGTAEASYETPPFYGDGFGAWEGKWDLYNNSMLDAMAYLPQLMYGFPSADAMMASLGFEFKDGRWQPTFDPSLGYDPRQLNQQMASTRDAMEPEMQRMLLEGGAALGERGLGDSSISAGLQGGMRGEYTQELMRQRLSLIDQLRNQRWNKLLSVIQGSQGLMSQQIGQQGGGGGTDWAQLGAVIAAMA